MENIAIKVYWSISISLGGKKINIFYVQSFVYSPTDALVNTLRTGDVDLRF